LNDINTNKMVELTLVDPELDRLYREHAIAVGLTVVQITQAVNYQEPDKDTNHDLETIEECSSTFSGL